MKKRIDKLRKYALDILYKEMSDVVAWQVQWDDDYLEMTGLPFA